MGKGGVCGENGDKKRVFLGFLDMEKPQKWGENCVRKSISKVKKCQRGVYFSGVKPVIVLIYKQGYIISTAG